MASMERMDSLVSMRKAQELTGVPRALIAHGVHAGELTGYRRDGTRTIFVRPSDVLAFLDKFRVRATDHADDVVSRRLQHEQGAGAP